MARGRGAVLIGIEHTVRVWGAGVVSGREWFVCMCGGGGGGGLSTALVHNTTFNLTLPYTRHLISVMGGLSLACW